MLLPSYTTTIGADKTVTEIHKILVQAGASSVSTDYEKGQPVGIRFTIETRFGPREFGLPANIEAVQKVLLTDYKNGRIQWRYTSTAHSARVAWRIVRTWVLAQLAIIETGMVSLDEVFFSYMLGPTGETIYQIMGRTQFALSEGRGER